SSVAPDFRLVQEHFRMEKKLTDLEDRYQRKDCLFDTKEEAIAAAVQQASQILAEMQERTSSRLLCSFSPRPSPRFISSCGMCINSHNSILHHILHHIHSRCRRLLLSFSPLACMCA